MAHFARVEEGIVTNVLVVPDEHESYGNEYLNGLGLDGFWLQTSYNTHGGVHLFGGVPLRKNYAGLGYAYDGTLDAFIPLSPYPSWVLDEETCLWDAPVPRPEDDKFYVWDEESGQWVEEAEWTR